MNKMSRDVNCIVDTKFIAKLWVYELNYCWSIELHFSVTIL